MDDVFLKIDPTRDPAEAVASLGEAKAVLSGETLLLTENAERPNAFFVAVRRKTSDDRVEVVARMAEWFRESRDTLRIRYVDETDGIGDDVCPPRIFTMLTPTDDHAALAWRDRSRAALAERGFFEPALNPKPTAETAADKSAGAAHSAQPQREIGARRSPADNARTNAPQNGGARTPRDERSEPRQRRTRRIVLLADRAVEPSESAGGSLRLRLSGYVLGNMNRFKKIIAWDNQARALADGLRGALEEAPCAKVELEGEWKRVPSPGSSHDQPGDVRDPFEFKVSGVVAVTPTTERIPSRDERQAQRRRSDQVEPAAERESRTKEQDGPSM